MEAKQKLNKILLEKIAKKAGRFNENDIYQLSWDIGYGFDFIKKLLNKFVKLGIVNKRYYNPYEERSANIPIGDDSYEVFSIKKEKLDPSNLF